MSSSLKNRSVLVTGGSRGIGKGIARVFAEAGARVAIVARHLDQAEAAAREIGPAAFGLTGDVTSLASMEAAMQAAVARNGGLDVLCANAGIFPPCRLEDMTCEQWDAVIDTNLKGTFHAARAAIPYLKQSDQVASSSPRRSPGRSPATPAGPIMARQRPVSLASCAPPASSWRNMASPSMP